MRLKRNLPVMALSGGRMISPRHRGILAGLVLSEAMEREVHALIREFNATGVARGH